MGSATIEPWNLETGESKGKFKTDSSSSIFTLVYSRDGRYLAAGGDARGAGRATTVLEIPSGKNLKTLQVSSDRVSFTPEGNYFAICNSPHDSDETKKIRLYDTDSEKMIWEQKENHYRSLLSFLQKGKYIISVAEIFHEGEYNEYYTSMVSLFDSKTGNKLWSHKSKDRINIEHLAVFSDGNYCAFISGEKGVWQTEEEKESITHFKYSCWIEIRDFHNGEFSDIPYKIDILRLSIPQLTGTIFICN